VPGPQQQAADRLDHGRDRLVLGEPWIHDGIVWIGTNARLG
jgi:hypothetical protein